MILTVDTDVVFLVVSTMLQISCKEVWIAFGVDKHFRYLPAHEMANALGPDHASCLPIFHSFTGCDTVSAFSSIGKKTAWRTWRVFDEVTAAFKSLSCAPQDVTSTTMDLLERFVVLLYDRTSEEECVNEARQKLFTIKGRTIENIPPTQHALMQHTKRAAFQGGHVWGQCQITSPDLPDPGEWGWQKTSGVWEPLWSILPEASRACMELIRCGCIKGCTGRCKCLNHAFKCTHLCKCNGDCEN